jgi:hypothetical protein
MLTGWTTSVHVLGGDRVQQRETPAELSVSEISETTAPNARFGYHVTVTGAGDTSALLGAARAAILKHGGSINGETPAMLVADFGSQATLRLLGAFFTPRQKWPVKLQCEVAPDGKPALHLTTSEDFGFGTLVGIEGKFRERCQSLLTEVAADVLAQLRTGTTT